MINELRTKVEKTLKEYPDTRNSDIALTIKIWEEYHAEKLVTAKNGKKYVCVENLYDLPREDNVKRIRAKIQNEENNYLPTTWEIAKKRGILRQQWEEALGYATKNYEEFKALKQRLL